MNVVLPDALFQYHLYAFLPDALPELHELGRGARGTRLYRLLLPEVLVVDILLSLLHDALVRHVAQVSQYQQLVRQLLAQYSSLKASSKTA